MWEDGRELLDFDGMHCDCGSADGLQKPTSLLGWNVVLDFSRPSVAAFGNRKD